MTLKEAESKFNVEIVDRDHLSNDDIQYWLNQDCNIKEDDFFIEFYVNKTFVYEIIK